MACLGLVKAFESPLLAAIIVTCVWFDKTDVEETNVAVKLLPRVWQEVGQDEGKQEHRPNEEEEKEKSNHNRYVRRVEGPLEEVEKHERHADRRKQWIPPTSGYRLKRMDSSRSEVCS